MSMVRTSSRSAASRVLFFFLSPFFLILLLPPLFSLILVFMRFWDFPHPSYVYECRKVVSSLWGVLLC